MYLSMNQTRKHILNPKQANVFTHTGKRGKEKPMKLYEINEAILNCVDPETGEADVEKLDELIMMRDEKLENLALWVKDLKAELENLKESTISEKINAIVEKALADHKINQATADKLKADYKSNVEGLQALIDAMPAHNTISSQLKAEVPEKYKGKTWNDLYKSGELADIKKNYPEFYKELKEAHEK